MNTTQVSLSKKILFLLPLTLVLTLTPILFISMHRTARDIELLYQESVKDVFRIYDISVQNTVQVQEFFKNLILSIPETRIDMIGRVFFEDLKKLMSKKPQDIEIVDFLTDFGERTMTLNLIVQAEDSTLTPLYVQKTSAPLPDLNMLHDDNGQNLQDILHNVEATHKGTVVFIPKDASTNTPPYVIHILPFPHKKFYLFSFLYLERLMLGITNIDKDIREQIRNFGMSMDFLDDGFTVTYDRSSQRVISQSSTLLVDANIAFAIPTDKTEGTKHTLPNGEVYILFTHTSSRDNALILTAIAQKTIDTIMHNMMYTQVIACLGIFLVGCIFASLIAHRLLAPMQHFTRLITRFSKEDVTKPTPQFLQALPLKRKDEVGDMARAFAGMTHILQKNVEELVHVTARQSRLDGELLAARASQEGFLPLPWPRIEGAPFHVDALLIPAREIGGDLYDYFTLDQDHVCLCIGDVSGKGMPAALVMGATTMLVRTSMQFQRSPEKAMHFVNNHLCKNNGQQMFVSLFIGLYCIKERSLTFSLAGHPAPIVFHTRNGADTPKTTTPENTAKPIPIPAPDLVIGLIPDIPYQKHHVRLTPQSRLLLYTDGITEAQNTQDDFYGEARLVNFCRGQDHASPAFLDSLLHDVQKFTYGTEQNDDITALLLTIP